MKIIPVYHETTAPMRIQIMASPSPFRIQIKGRVNVPAPSIAITIVNIDEYVPPF
jgi:hypothetical protein